MGNCFDCCEEKEGSTMEAYSYYFQKDFEENQRLTSAPVCPPVAPRPSAPPLSPEKADPTIFQG
jgi:hypothetical protein